LAAREAKFMTSATATLALDGVAETSLGLATAAPRAIEAVLTTLRPGEQGFIARLEVAEPAQLKKLIALGILPGSALQLRRRSPCFVIRVGHSEFAFDEQVASQIVVRTLR
jgi:Fe2+ transport system protein FeoA